MYKHLLFSLLFLAPSLASAHPGHHHVGSEAGHHFLEIAAFVAAAAIAVGIFRAVASKSRLSASREA